MDYGIIFVGAVALLAATIPGSPLPRPPLAAGLPYRRLQVRARG
jgi:hypothetical protein